MRDRPDSLGYTPLHLAAIFGHPFTLRALLLPAPDPFVGIHFAKYLRHDFTTSSFSLFFFFFFPLFSITSRFPLLFLTKARWYGPYRKDCSASCSEERARRVREGSIGRGSEADSVRCRRVLPTAPCLAVHAQSQVCQAPIGQGLCTRRSHARLRRPNTPTPCSRSWECQGGQGPIGRRSPCVTLRQFPPYPPPLLQAQKLSGCVKPTCL